MKKFVDFKGEINALDDKNEIFCADEKKFMLVNITGQNNLKLW